MASGRSSSTSGSRKEPKEPLKCDRCGLPATDGNPLYAKPQRKFIHLKCGAKGSSK